MKQNRAKIIGITGGVGAGKSKVLDYLAARWDAHVIQADLIAHQQMRGKTRCYEEIVQTFGSAIIGPDGELDRKLLGSIVFQDEKRLQQLNGIVHPAVKRAITAQIKQMQEKKRLIVVEAALLIEDHYNEICDELWYIYASEAIRRQRLREGRGYSDERITQIISQQLKEEQFRAHCEVVLYNNGAWEDTKRQIDEKINLLN